jgi:hypothetical protein
MDVRHKCYNKFWKRRKIYSSVEDTAFQIFYILFSIPHWFYFSFIVVTTLLLIEIIGSRNTTMGRGINSDFETVKGKVFPLLN